MDLLSLLVPPNWVFWTLGLLGIAYIYLTWNFDYWKKQGIPGSKPYPLIGTFYVIFQRKIFEVEPYALKKYGKVYGGFSGRTPTLGVADTDILRLLLIKDFANFRERLNFELPGVMKTSLFHVRGERWHELRHLLTPVFTSGKLKQLGGLCSIAAGAAGIKVVHSRDEACKTKRRWWVKPWLSRRNMPQHNNAMDLYVEFLDMLQLITLASKNFVENMAVLCDQNQPFEMKKYTGAFTMDVISSVAFGLDIDSQKNKDDPFVFHAKKLMDVSFTDPLLWCMLFCPSLLLFAERNGLWTFKTPSEDFFCKVVKDTLKQRKQGVGVRSDMLQLMLEAERLVEEADEDTRNQLKEDGLDTFLSGRKKAELSEDDMIAQSVLFFLAGYETTANTLAFLYYCLAVNPDIQNKVVEEIDAILGERSEARPEDLSKMSYLEMCINETLRMYPPVIRTDRISLKDCELKGIKIKKGTMVGIPIRAIHYNPEVWPEPETFDPERFTPEAKASRDSMNFLPFGQGPRMCIGNRLAIMEIKQLTSQFLRNYRLVTCSETQIPIRLANKIVLSAEKGIWLKVESRDKQ